MKLRRMRAVARKEFLHVWRDPRSLIMALALPGLMLLLFGYALTLDVDRIPMLVYDLDHSPQSRELLSRFEGSRYFNVVGTADHYQTIERAIDRGTAMAALVISAEFSEELSRDRNPSVQILFDGSDSNTASIGLGYAEGILNDYSFELQSRALGRKGGTNLKPALDSRLRVWYNPELESKNFIVPGLLAVILMIIASLLTSLTIAREWELGSMEQLLSTPVKASELVLGKMSAYFLLGVADALITILVGVWVFEVPLRGNILLLGFTCFIFLFGALNWGILISALARSQLLAYQMGMITSFLPAFLLSGFIFPIENMPVAIQIPTYLVPARYFIHILRGVFLKGVGLEIIWLEVLFLSGFSLLVFLLARHRLQGKVA